MPVCRNKNPVSHDNNNSHSIRRRKHNNNSTSDYLQRVLYSQNSAHRRQNHNRYRHGGRTAHLVDTHRDTLKRRRNKDQKRDEYNNVASFMAKLRLAGGATLTASGSGSVIKQYPTSYQNYGPKPVLPPDYEETPTEVATESDENSEHGDIGDEAANYEKNDEVAEGHLGATREEEDHTTHDLAKQAEDFLGRLGPDLRALKLDKGKGKALEDTSESYRLVPILPSDLQLATTVPVQGEEVEHDGKTFSSQSPTQKVQGWQEKASRPERSLPQDSQPSDTPSRLPAYFVTGEAVSRPEVRYRDVQAPTSNGTCVNSCAPLDPLPFDPVYPLSSRLLPGARRELREEPDAVPHLRFEGDWLQGTTSREPGRQLPLPYRQDFSCIPVSMDTTPDLSDFVMDTSPDAEEIGVFTASELIPPQSMMDVQKTYTRAIPFSGPFESEPDWAFCSSRYSYPAISFDRYREASNPSMVDFQQESAPGSFTSTLRSALASSSAYDNQTSFPSPSRPSLLERLHSEMPLPLSSQNLFHGPIGPVLEEAEEAHTATAPPSSIAFERRPTALNPLMADAQSRFEPDPVRNSSSMSKTFLKPIWDGTQRDQAENVTDTHRCYACGQVTPSSSQERPSLNRLSPHHPTVEEEAEEKEDVESSIVDLAEEQGAWWDMIFESSWPRDNAEWTRKTFGETIVDVTRPARTHIVSMARNRARSSVLCRESRDKSLDYNTGRSLERFEEQVKERVNAEDLERSYSSYAAFKLQQQQFDSLKKPKASIRHSETRRSSRRSAKQPYKYIYTSSSARRSRQQVSSSRTTSRLTGSPFGRALADLVSFVPRFPLFSF
ncbi:hypothetical protein PQX77_002606 [Marasmius sp. AFHP31]|nr:hypothetical protein PQX77_002606 [Marasmius sp. AFHP31]